jgi:hypothetical protein
MFKLFQSSFLVLAVALPLWSARDRSIVRGARRAVVTMLAMTLAYAVMIAFILPRFA